MGDVHVWWATLDLQQPQVQRLARLASRAECERADRFRRPRDRDRFLVRRGFLRLLLARYLDSDPDRVAFRSGPNGKPELDPGTRGPALHFNTSHSHGLGLFAFAVARRVGIDVEALRPVPEAERIAEHFFSPRECAALRALPAAERHEGFLRRWTCKEAYLKATGEGLSQPMQRIEIELTSNQHERPVVLQKRSGEPSWILQQISPPAGYVGALVVEDVGICPGSVRSAVAPLPRRTGTPEIRLRLLSPLVRD
jgi:4'-phosphopantetheinyl transferase